MLSKVKTIIIFVLSIVLALESGAIAGYIGAMSTLQKGKTYGLRRTYNYRGFYDKEGS